jgi:hypothetical protein
MRSTLLLTLVLLASQACTGAAADDDPAADCARYRDHAIELSLRSAREIGGADLSEELIAAHKAQMSAALARQYETRCAELTRVDIDCGLGASTATELAACTGGNR